MGESYARCLGIRDGYVVMEVLVPNELVSLSAYTEKWHKCQLKLLDSKKLSKEQQSKVYCLLREIAVHHGYSEPEMKAVMKRDFGVAFSLADCDMELASRFMEHLLEHIFVHDIPTSEKGFAICKEINGYMFKSLMHRKCCVCWKRAEIHHHEKLVGMGRDRNAFDHSKSKFLPLCRAHHSEAHNIGLRTFESKYHVAAVGLSQENIKELGL